MNFSNLRTTLRAHLMSGVINGRRPIAMALISSPGRGKSSWVEQQVAELSEEYGEEFGLAVAFLATYTPVDMMGTPFKGHRVMDGVEYTITDLAMPQWFITRSGKPVTAYKRGILFLDEFGQAEGDVKRSAADLILNGRIGPWVLPEGWIVITAENRTTDRSGVTKSYDFVINRRSEYHITDDIAAWIDWADGAGVNPVIKAFAKNHPAIVFTDGVPKEQGPWCTPRSLVMAGELLAGLQQARGDKELPMDGMALGLVSSIIGEAAAAQMMATIKLQHEMPPFEEIIKDPKGCKVPEKPDAQMLVTYTLAHRVDAKTADPVLKYVDRMMKDMAVTFATAAIKRVPSLAATPAFSGWITKNASLIAAIGTSKR